LASACPTRAFIGKKVIAMQKLNFITDACKKKTVELLFTMVSV
jgi:hypothetical protein